MSGISGAVAQTLRKRADAALQNEQVTRARVDTLEAAVQIAEQDIETLEKQALVLGRSLSGRLRWLLFGR